MLAAEEQAEILAAQSEELAGNVPAFEDTVRSATQRANEQRGVAGKCSNRFNCWRPNPATSTTSHASFTLRRDRLSSEKQALGSPDEARLTDLKRQLEAVQEELACV
jgi:chromosome segregation protein